MTIGLLLTGIFVILKLTETVDWSWWTVVLPSLIEAGIGILFFVIWSVLGILILRKG